MLSVECFYAIRTYHGDRCFAMYTYLILRSNLLNGRSFGFYDKRISGATFDQMITTLFKMCSFLLRYAP